MKSPVSLEYVIVVTLLAAASAVLTYTSPSPALNLATLLLGIYALHLVSVRVVVREYAGTAVTRPRRSRRGSAEADEVRELREELERERAELANQRTELQQRIVAAEQQWDVLRQMIREKVESGVSLPDSVVAGSVSDGAVRGSGRSSGSDQLPRVHGRW
jgi:hypothetical protein